MRIQNKYPNTFKIIAKDGDSYNGGHKNMFTDKNVNIKMYYFVIPRMTLMINYIDPTAYYIIGSNHIWVQVKWLVWV